MRLTDRCRFLNCSVKKGERGGAVPLLEGRVVVAVRGGESVTKFCCPRLPRLRAEWLYNLVVLSVPGPGLSG
jgi:hypothetical protein